MITEPTTYNQLSRDLLNVKYGENEGMEKLLNVYAPTAKYNSRALIYCAGGTGERVGQTNDQVKLLKGEGYTLFAPDYSTNKENPKAYPNWIRNLHGAIRHIKANAAQYGINPNNVFAIGTSSGGVATALMATTGDWIDPEGLDNVGGNLQFNNRIRAGVDCFGSVYFGLKLVNGKWVQYPNSKTPLSTLQRAYLEVFGCTGTDVFNTCEQAKKLMVYNFITGKDRPLMFIHGEQDEHSYYMQSVDLEAALKAAGVKTDKIIDPIAIHDPALISKYKTNILNWFNLYAR